MRRHNTASPAVRRVRNQLKRRRRHVRALGGQAGPMAGRGKPRGTGTHAAPNAQGVGVAGQDKA